MPYHYHSIPTYHADTCVIHSSLPSNRPCCPLCRSLLTPIQPAVLTVLRDHSHSTPTGRPDRYAGNPHYLPPCRADRDGGPFSLPFNRDCSPLFRTRLIPLQPAVLTAMPDHLTPLQLDVLIVMANHPHSFSTGRAHRYIGSSQLHTNRPCLPSCWTVLIPFQPAMLTIMPDHFHSTPIGCADSYPGPSHSLPTGRADRYAGPSSLYSKRPR